MSRINNLNILFDANVYTSFEEIDDETEYYRSRDLYTSNCFYINAWY
jgi:hypothetical protein